MAEIQQLKDMGFGAAEAEVALRETSGNVEQALELLLTGALPTSPDAKDRKDAAVSPKKPPDSEWPELPKRPAAPTPSSPSGYGKSDAKPPGLEDEAALGLSLEAGSLSPWLKYFHCHASKSVNYFHYPSAGERANTTNATTSRAAVWLVECGKHLLTP